MKKHHKTLLPILITAASLATSHAAVLTEADPAGMLVTGANAIDPAGSETVDQSVGTITAAALEARPDFVGALQDLGVGFDGGNTGTFINFISFTDTTLADIRITVTASGNNPSSVNINDQSRVTSGSNGLRQVSAGTIRFDFGEFDGTTFTLGKVVDAVGFTIGNLRSTMTFDVQFLDAGGTALTPTQTIATPTAEAVTPGSGGSASSDGIEGYFSYASDGTFANGIASVLITRTGGSNISSSTDDFGFTSAIPEPTTVAMLLGGLGTLLLLRRRRA